MKLVSYYSILHFTEILVTISKLKRMTKNATMFMLLRHFLSNYATSIYFHFQMAKFCL